MSQTPFPILPSRKLLVLGERIALARRARELNQRDLAFLAGVGASSIVALEKGHPGVAIGTLVRVLDALGLLSEMDHLVEPQRDTALTQFAISQLVGKNDDACLDLAARRLRARAGGHAGTWQRPRPITL